jgi:hypothetical protein
MRGERRGAGHRIRVRWRVPVATARPPRTRLSGARRRSAARQAATARTYNGARGGRSSPVSAAARDRFELSCAHPRRWQELHLSALRVASNAAPSPICSRTQRLAPWISPGDMDKGERQKRVGHGEERERRENEWLRKLWWRLIFRFPSDARIEALPLNKSSGDPKHGRFPIDHISIHIYSILEELIYFVNTSKCTCLIKTSCCLLGGAKKRGDKTRRRTCCREQWQVG